jgi:hypothetical protein
MTDASRPRWLAFCVGFLDHPNLSGEPYDRRSAFHWLIENAAWKDHKVRTRGGMIELKRGQVLVAREHLAKAWKWSPGKVRLFLSQMVAADMLEMSQSNGHYANVATVCNYDKYQTKPVKPEPINRPVKSQSKASGVASEKPHSTRDTRDTSSEATASGEPPRDDDDTTSDSVTEVEAEPVPDDQRKRFDRQGAADDGMRGDILPPVNVAIPEPRDENHAKQLLWGPVREFLASQPGATDASVRGQLGQLRKASGNNDLAIVRAAVTAQRTNQIDPLPYIRRFLNPKPGSRNGRSTASARDIFENLDQPTEERRPWVN